MPAPIPTTPTPESIAVRMRSLRKAKGWSLSDVERASQGLVTAAALGSYERGDRNLTIRTALIIARIYQVPLSHLLEVTKDAQARLDARVVLDLRRLAVRTSDEEPPHIALVNFVRSISLQRGDWNGEIMSLRRGDLRTVALMSLIAEGEMSIWLKEKDLELRRD